MESSIKDSFKGYHVDISLYPSGGMIDVNGCKECGTSEAVMHTALWKTKNGETLEWAIDKLKDKLKGG